MKGIRYWAKVVAEVGQERVGRGRAAKGLSADAVVTAEVPPAY